MDECKICKRILNQAHDPLSLDCGGDCYGCILDVERELHHTDIVKFRDRIIGLETKIRKVENTLLEFDMSKSESFKNPFDK